MTADDQVGYLTADTAAWLRQAMEPITDVILRRNLTGIAEQCFRDGNNEGYTRGYTDGCADVTAQTVAAVMAEQGVTPSQPSSPESPPAGSQGPPWPSGSS
jgi:hypothetical protein